MKIFKRILLAVLVLAVAVSALGITNAVPHFAVVPDMVKVGVDYISINRNGGAVSESELKNAISNSQAEHPFVLADKADFDLVRREYAEKSFTDYTAALSSSVTDNADALLDMNVFPLMPYVLDEEDSILPISREVISRIIILGTAWQMTGEEKYALRAWQELENVCGYDDWCTGHFLATAEMAFAVAVGYDWLFGYLTESQKSLLAETVLEYAVRPALSKNYLKNWFTWSKNNWNSICYGGIGIACMAFGSYFPDEAAEFLEMCYENMPIAFENFTPHGVYAEGPGYSNSGMNAIVYFVSTSKNYFGTDYGLSDTDGFRQLGNFPAYVTTPTGVFNFGDNKNRTCFTPVMHWYASEYGAPLLAVYQMQDMPGKFEPDTSDATERNSGGREDALSLLWYNRGYTRQSADFSDEPLAVKLESDMGQELVLMRSAYLDKNASFAGIKGGYNGINHGDLDIGTFVFDSMGERWAEELGPGGYDAPGYFLNLPAGGRWKNYCKRAEGQNTLVINPDYTLDDQYALAQGKFIAFSENENGGTCTLDMTDAYRMNGASGVIREFELYNGRTSLKITDKIKCVTSSEIYWFMHTKAQIDIQQGGKTAVLTLNGKQMKATLHGDGEFSVMPAQKLGGAYEYDEKYTDISKLTVRLDGVKQAEICVTLEPVK